MLPAALEGEPFFKDLFTGMCASNGILRLSDVQVFYENMNIIMLEGLIFKSLWWWNTYCEGIR